MKLSEMIHGVRYVVTKGSKRGALRVGDNVTMDVGNAILCTQAQGWIEEGDWRKLRAEVEVDKDWHQHKAEYHKEQMEKHLRLGA